MDIGANVADVSTTLEDVADVVDELDKTLVELEAVVDIAEEAFVRACFCSAEQCLKSTDMVDSVV